MNKEIFESKFEIFERALNTFKYAIIEAKKVEKADIELFQIYRDSVIQRFEYTYEMAWKFMKFLGRYAEKEIEINTFHQTIKVAFKSGYIDNMKIWFKISDDRNKTNHEYEENIANDLYFEILKYLDEIQKFYELVKIRYGQGYFNFDT